MSPWSSLESIPGLSNFPSRWQFRLGDHFPAFKILCLQPNADQPQSYPCPRECGCWHRIIRRHDATGAVAACRCTPPNCPDLALTNDDITPLEVNRPKLGRALCRALLLNSKPADLALPFTAQIGSWSADPVPAILTIQTDPELFRRVVADLVATLNQPFILLAPTATHLDAHCQQLLARVRAAFFALESHLILTPSGTLQPRAPPGELFARFTPQPKEPDEDVARRAFALVQQFDPETLAVFRLYCVDALSAAETAAKCHSSKSTVIRRLKLIHAKTGISPIHLRQLSPHIAKIEDQINDPRARHIYRQNLIDDQEPGGSEP